MITLEKITARYLAHEDRIAITGDGGKDGAIRLWLIRPLTEKLVSALVNVLRPRHENRDNAEAMNAFAQSGAERRYAPSPPVEFFPGAGDERRGDRPESPLADSPEGAEDDGIRPQPVASASPGSEWLVKEMNLKVLTSSFSLTFRGEAGQEAGCSFSEVRLRQLLGILRRVCQNAGWTNPDWPDWLQKLPKDEDQTSSFH